MSVLGTLYSLALNVLAQDPAPKKEIVEPETPWFGEDGYFAWWQVILFLVLIGLVAFLFYYRKKQQNM